MPDTSELKLKVGDRVMWRGGFGMDAPKLATVTALELTTEPHCKYGLSVQSVDWFLAANDYVLVTLDNGHWAYGPQIQPV